jgi:hypothetical protein
MHNLPTNNETNIIRNIFTQSSNLINEGVSGKEKGKGGRGKGKLKTDRAARDAQREADREAAEEKAATPTNIFPAADLGNLGPQTRTVSTADRLQLPNGKYVDLQRDDQGRVVGQQDVPPEPKPKKERTQAQIDAALEGGRKAAETRAQRDPTEAEWYDRNKRKLPPLIGPTGKNVLKYTGAGMGAAMLGGSIAGPLFTNNWDDKGEGEDRRYSTIEDRPVTPKPAPAPAPTPKSAPTPAAAPEVKPTQTTLATKPAAPTNFVEITPEEQAKIDAQKQNKNLGGLAASYGLGTTDDVRARSQTVVDQLASTFNNIANTPSKPAAPAKLPEQPMDSAVAEFKKREKDYDQYQKDYDQWAKNNPEALKQRLRQQRREFHGRDPAYVTTTGDEIYNPEIAAKVKAQEQQIAQMNANTAAMNSESERIQKEIDRLAPITDFSPEAERKRTAARDQARFGTYQGVPVRDTGYGTMKPIAEVYYRRLANLFEETRDSLEDISAKRRERQVQVAGLEGQVNPHGFVDLVKGIRNVQAFSGMGGADMPKERVEKSSENVGERTVPKADQRKALMKIMSASQDHADLKDRFTKEDALNPHSPLHKMLVSRNPDLRDESKVMAKYYTGS